MKIMILDNEPERHDVFGDRWAEHELTHVWTYAQAIEALERETFDRLALDHDLALRLPEPGELTGYDVARYLVERVPRERWPKQVVLHSHNGRGRRAMAELLLAAGGMVVVDAPFKEG